MTGEALEAEATSVDDTRDIAIRAEQSSSSAHKRLDTINGQIGKLANSHQDMRDDFNRAIYGTDGNELDGGLVGAFLELRSTVTHALKVAGVVVGAVITITTGITVYMLERTSTAQKPSRALTVRHHHSTGAARQRGSSAATHTATVTSLKDSPALVAGVLGR